MLASILGRFVLGFGRLWVGEEVGDVFFAQLFGGTNGELVHGEGADAGAHQLGDAQTEGLEHETDLAFEAGFENDSETAGGDALAVFGARLTNFGDVNPFDELEENLGFVILVDGDLIFLLELFGRVGQLLGEVAIIGQNEEALGVEVEASDMLEVMVFVGEPVINGLPIALVAF